MEAPNASSGRHLLEQAHLATDSWKGGGRWSLRDEDAIPLARLEVARCPTLVLLGHEHSGLPPEVWPFLDVVVEIPMLGAGDSLNVAVAGSLVLYKLAGLS